ncbi:MAG: hypothetical protein HQ503_16905 [Rhodospirillales bacterium]|nr:hypothetical protein [Rhodospirillales bacterium]
MNQAVIFVLIFVIASAARDVYFGEIFQRLRFFEVVLIAFSLTTLVFSAFVLLAQRKQLTLIAGAWREALLTNIGTAMAWLSYFFALKLLEPAVVNMLHIGIGPVLLVTLNALGIHISGKAEVRKSELVIQGGVLASLVALATVVLVGQSGLAGRPFGQNLLGLGFAFASGIFISLSTDVTKRLNNKGVSPEGVLAIRFVGILLVAGIAVAFGANGDDMGGLASRWDILWPIALASLFLMVAPLYALQLGVQRASTVSVWIIISLSPTLVFAAQFFDGRLTYAPLTLACIMLYSALAVASNMARKFETKANK